MSHCVVILTLRLGDAVDAANRQGRQARQLNVGAGRSVRAETDIERDGRDFVCDRLDIGDPSVDHPRVGVSWRRTTRTRASAA